ncbi:ribose 5-phosphate isomerase A-domain-containing protein [Crassisporium funariophilum]|nr:ribose 5-phosphate isomerase A-domain-containing protein [Crassisporium funariophilum]
MIKPVLGSARFLRLIFPNPRKFTANKMPLPAQANPDIPLTLPPTPVVSQIRPASGLPPSASILGRVVQVPVKVPMDAIEQSKRLAAYQAVDNHVKPEHRVIGIGSGSTVPYVVERIVQQGPEVNKGRVFIPTGFQSKALIVAAHLGLGDVDEYPTIDVTLDGADEVDHQLNCVKGGGACHLREKVLAEAATTFILVADHRKNVQYLGTNFVQGVPIEVVPFAYAKVLQNLHLAMESPRASLRMAVKKAGPVVTDNGNFIIDAPFDRKHMEDPYVIMAQIKMLTGVVEVGLFCHMAKAAYFGNEDGSVTVRWNDGKVEQIAAV